MRNAFKVFFFFFEIFCWSDDNSKRKSEEDSLQLGLNLRYLALGMWFLTSYKRHQTHK